MKESKLHLVKLDENILNNYDDLAKGFYSNIKNHIFKGYLVNVSSKALYLEPEKDRNNALIIVPHAWIKWCVPIEEGDKNNNV